MKRVATNPKYTLVYIGFPDGEVKCAHCPLLETYSRNLCRRTGEYITDTRFPGYNCPLVEIGEDELKEHIAKLEAVK